MGLVLKLNGKENETERESGEFRGRALAHIKELTSRGGDSYIRGYPCYHQSPNFTLTRHTHTTPYSH